MIVILHVIVAVLSIGLTSYAYVRPSAAKLHVAYGLVAMTLASGLYLVWSAPVHMVQACTAGVLYVGIVSIGIVAAKAKLIAAKNSH